MEVEKVHLGQSVCKRETAHNLLLLLTLCVPALIHLQACHKPFPLEDE